MFLPDGYPSSVSEDYLQYQIWDTVQVNDELKPLHFIIYPHVIEIKLKAFCSSVSGALAARAMFETIGVGDENSTVYGATLTWLIKGNTP